MANRINFGIGFNVADTSALNKIKTQLQELQKLSAVDLHLAGDNAEATLASFRRELSQVSDLWDRSFNKELGTVNVAKLHKGINEVYGSLGQMQQRFSAMGTVGERAFRDISIAMLSSQKEVKKTFEWVDKLGTTFANTLRWTISSTALNTLTGSIQQAYHYAVDLDTSLNDIRIVTGKSADEMDRFARIANKAAKGLGASTKDFTEAALIYYQQGLSDAEANARAEITLKAANVTGQSADAVSEQLTAVWNGYKVSAQEAELYVDKLAAVAATTAADLEELSTGMSKVASAANSMGVDVDQLSAQLATIISVTRQAPEAVGTALKTIYARMGDLQLGETDEDGVQLGDVSSQLAQVGVQVLDATGNLRDMGAVTEEVAAKWNTWTEAQQQAVAIAMAGKRQYNNLIALFENWDMYESSLSTAANSMGTLQTQQDIYMESTEAHLEKLGAAMEGIYDSLFDQDEINGVIDALTNLANSIEVVINSLGGGTNILMLFTSVMLDLQSAKIASGILKLADWFRIAKENAEAARIEVEMMAQARGLDLNDKYVQQAIQSRQTLAQYEEALTKEQIAYRRSLIESSLEIAHQEDLIKDQYKSLRQYLNEALAESDSLEIDLDSESALEDIDKLSDKYAELRANIQGTQKGFADASQAAPRKTIQDAERDLLKAQREYANKVGESKASSFGAAANSETAAFEAGQALGVFENGQFQKDLREIEEWQSYLMVSPEDKAEILSIINEIKAKYLGSFDEIEKAYAKVQKIYKEGEENFDVLSATFGNDLTVVSDEDAAILQELITRYHELDEAQRASGEGAKIAADFQEKYREALKKAEKQAEANEKVSKRLKAEAEAQKRAQETLTEAQKKANEEAKRQNAIAAFTRLTSTVTMAISVVNTLHSSISALFNEDLSDWEKVSTFIIGIISSLGMILTLIKTLSESITMLNQNLNLKTVFQALSLVIHKQELNHLKNELALEKNITEEKAKQLVLDKLDQDNANTGISSKGIKSGTSGKFINIGKTATNAAAQGTKSVAMGAQGTANAAGALGSGSAITSLASTLATVLPIIAGIAVVIAAIWIGVSIANKEMNKYAEAAKKAAENQEALTEAYNQTKSAYDGLVSSFEKYNEMQTAMDDMIEGTEEWNKALRESNAYVIELLQKYPQLAQYINRENGRLTISETGQQEMLAAQEAAVNASYRAQLQGAVALNQARQKASAEELAKDNSFSYMDFGSFMEGLNKGLIWNIIEDSMNGELGYSYKNSIGKEDLETVASIIAEDPAALESRDALVEALDKNGLSNITAYGALVDSLWNNADKISELSQEIATNSAVNEQLNYQIVDSYLAEQGGAAYSAYDNKDALNRVFTELTLANEEVKEKAEKEIEALSDEQLKQNYAKANSMTINEEGKLVTSDGEIFEAYSKEMAKQALLIDKVLGKSGKTVNQLMTSINNFVAKSDNKNISSALAELVGLAEGDIANFAMLTQGEVSELSNIDLSELSLAQIQDLGYESLEELQKAINEATESYAADFKEILSSAPSILPKQDDPIWDKFSLDQAKNLISVAKSLSDIGQQDAYTALMDATEDDAELIELISKIDWSKQNAVDSFRQAIIDENLEIEDGALDNFITQIQIAEDTLANFSAEDFVNNFKFYKESLEGLKFGDIISKEEFEKLTPELREYFDTTADGNYRLIKSGFAFSEAAKKEYASLTGEIDKASVKYDNSIKEKRSVKRDIEEAREGGYLDVSKKRASVGYTAEEIAQIKDTLNVDNAPSEAAKNILNKVIYKLEHNSPLDEQDYQILDMYGVDTSPLKFSDIEQAIKQVNYLSAKGAGGQFDTDRDRFNEVKDRVLKGIGRPEDYDYLAERMSTVEDEHISLYQEGRLTAVENETNEARKNLLDSIIGSIDRAATEEDLSTFTSDYIKKYFIEGSDEYNQVIEKIAEQSKEIEFLQLENQFRAGEAALKAFAEELDKLKEKAQNLTGINLLENLGLQEDKINKGLDAINLQLSVIPEMNSDMYKSYSALTGDYSIMMSRDSDGSKLFTWENYAKYAASGASKEQLEEFAQQVELVESLTEEQEQYNEELANMPLRRLQAVTDSLTKAREATQKNIEFQRSLLEEEDSAGFFKSYMEEAESYFGTGEFQQRLHTINTLLSQEDLTEAQREALLQEQDALIEMYGSVEEAIQSAYDTYYEAIENVTTATEKQIEEIQRLNDQYDYQLELMELLGKAGEDLFDIEDLYTKKNQNFQLQLNGIQQAMDDLLAKRNAEGIADEEQEKLDEQILALSEKYQDIASSFIQSLNESLQSFVSEAFEDLRGDLEAANEEWGLLNKKSEMYLDDVNSAYEIRKLENKYVSSIDSASGLSAQNKLNKLMQDELKALREKDKLTQYDIDRANLRYDIALKQIALEEAQQNKSKMRLRRDASGNYSYQFVTDESAVAEAQQELMDLENQLYNLDLDAYKSNLDEVLALTSEFEEKYMQIIQSGLQGEELNEAINKLVQDYTPMFDLLGTSNDSIISNLTTSFANFDTAFLDSEAQELMNSFKEDGFATKASTLITETLNKAGQIHSQIASIVGQQGGGEGDSKTEGSGLLGMWQSIDDIIAGLIEDNDIATAIDQLAAVDADLENLKAIESTWDAIKTDIEEAVSAVTAFNALTQQDTFDMMLKSREDVKGIYSSDASYASQILGPLFNELVSPYGKKLEENGSLSASEISYVKAVYDYFKSKLNGADLKNLTAFSDDTQRLVSYFDTGGYTGEWGSDGRLAVLHEKEIVLNKDDTQNFLYALEIARALLESESSLLQQVQGYALQNLSGVPMLESAIGGGFEQNVVINASFPDATDRVEIEAAFENLVNLATQRANQNNR